MRHRDDAVEKVRKRTPSPRRAAAFRRVRFSAHWPSASANRSEKSVPGEISRTSKGGMRFGDGRLAPRSVTSPSARTPSLAFNRLCRTVTTFARGSGPSRKKPTDVRARQTECVVAVFEDVKMLSTLPTTRFTASRPLLQRRAALWTTLVMSTTTWSAAKALPRASEAALPNCSTSQAWNFETPIVYLCTVMRGALRVPTLDAAASLRPNVRISSAAHV